MISITRNEELFSKKARGLFYLSEKTRLLINGKIIKLSDCSPSYFHFLNFLCYPDVISFTNDLDQKNMISRKRIYYKKSFFI